MYGTSAVSAVGALSASELQRPKLRLATADDTVRKEPRRGCYKENGDTQGVTGKAKLSYMAQSGGGSRAARGCR